MKQIIFTGDDLPEKINSIHIAEHLKQNFGEAFVQYFGADVFVSVYDEREESDIRTAFAAIPEPEKSDEEIKAEEEQAVLDEFTIKVEAVLRTHGLIP